MPGSGRLPAATTWEDPLAEKSAGPRRGPLRLSVRTRLTALHGGFFLLAGLVLVVVTYLVVSNELPAPAQYLGDDASLKLSQVAADVESVPAEATTLPVQAVPASAERVATVVLTDYRSSTMSALVLASAVALVVTAALALLFGWFMAGRALRPLHTITSTARRLEAGKLDQRINLDGPRDELKELADTFDSMLDRLAGSFDSQKRFVANASHELRTPLAVQRTLIEVALENPEAGPVLTKLGAHLLRTNERSERLIEGLLVLARSDRGLSARAPVRLDKVVRAVVKLTAAQAKEAGVTVETRLRARTVIGDAVLLERLVLNLVSNAISYNIPDGWVSITIGATPALSVRNSGSNVDEREVAGLFEPFRRGKPDRTGAAEHSGLGLSIVRSVARAHGGDVCARANPNGGLTVEARLPA
ncbi:HAMP domain-containing protein [Amycolatopsis rubida]|uniref:histidine kinase n=1 Tax=Amycolatopsis rubida TaxID=112413 RepID=A0ABX0BPK2_9PSEU|nr:HAMP domain-containing protein [Amycolatopsis rubida]NEC56345.1 HAMP domain-containing protein [Amycolatopsis rubida]